MEAIEKGGRRGTLSSRRAAHPGGSRRSRARRSARRQRLRQARPRPVGGSSTAALRLERARSVASSLDLRGARVEEALEALDRYLDDAGLAGLGSVTIIHGLGTGALRDAVRAAAAVHPLVRSTRPGERGEGGDGATIVSY